MKPTTRDEELALKRKYLCIAIGEYEYSPAPEFDKSQITELAATQGTVDFDDNNPETAVELSIDGAWVNARVWIPKEWVQRK